MRSWFLLVSLLFAGPALAVPVNAQTADEPKPSDEPAVAETIGKLTLTLDAGGHTGTMVKVLFTPEGRLITSSQDGSIRVWDVETGRTRQVLRLPGALSQTAVALSRDGKALAAASSHYDAGKPPSRMIYLVGVADGRIRRTLATGHVAVIRALAFAPDGTRLASSSSGTGKDNRLEIASLDKDAPPQVLKPKSPVVALAFSSDGKRLVEAHPDGFDIRLLTGDKVTQLPGGSLPPPYYTTQDCVAWSRDGKFVATAGRDGVRLWQDGKFGKEKFHLGNKKLYAYAVSFSADSSQLLVTWDLRHNKSAATVFDVKTGMERARLSPKVSADSLRSPGNSAFAPDGKRVLTVGYREGAHTAVLWRTKDGSEIKRLGARSWLTGTDLHAGWGADGNTVSWRSATDSATAKRKLGSFDLAALALRPAPTDKVLGALHEQGPFNLNRQDNQTVQVLKDKNLVVRLKLPADRKLGKEMTLLGKNRAILGEGGSHAELFDLDTGKPIRRLLHDGPLRGLAPSPNGKYLLSFSFGQRLHIWSLERQYPPLLTLYVAGQDWVAWTDKGYYAATPGGERLIGWTVDNGIDKDTTYYPVERFRKQMRRPDVIKLLLEKGDLKEALAAANAALRKEGKVVAEGAADLEKLLPPRATVAIVPSKLPTLKLRVSAEASVKNQPITSLRLMMDGRVVPGAETQSEFRDGKQKVDNVEWTLELPEGEHQIAVLARGPDSSSVSTPVRIKHEDQTRLPVLHVLTVGINNYKDNSLDLKYAVPDAVALAAAFEKHCKGQPFRDVRAKTLRNEEATATQIENALREIRTSAQQRDLVVVFFACHGVKQKKEYYLLTHEADTDKLDKTSLSGDALRKILAEYKCQVLLMLDACHSAGFGAGKKLSKLGLKPATDDATRDLTDDDVGVAVMCAAMAHEKAEGVGGYGLFTKTVLEALEGGPKVPVNPFNQRLYVHHMQSYVFDHVSNRSEQRQHPFLCLPWIVESFPVR